MNAKHYRPCQPQGSLHLNDILNTDSNSGPERECQLPEVTQHQSSDLEYCPWKPCESCQDLPELILPHVVDVQGLFSLRQDPQFHLPTSLSLPTLLFCLEGEESQAKDGTWRLNLLSVLRSRPVPPPDAQESSLTPPPSDSRGSASALLPQISDSSLSPPPSVQGSSLSLFP